jgi:hypothetical protein
VLHNVKVIGRLNPIPLHQFADREPGIKFGTTCNGFIRWLAIGEAIGAIEIHPIERVIVTECLRQSPRGGGSDLFLASDKLVHESKGTTHDLGKVVLRPSASLKLVTNEFPGGESFCGYAGSHF